MLEHRYAVTLTQDQLQLLNDLKPCFSPAEVSRILFENFDNLNGAITGLVDFYKANYERIMAEQEAARAEAKANANWKPGDTTESTEVIGLSNNEKGKTNTFEEYDMGNIGAASNASPFPSSWK